MPEPRGADNHAQPFDDGRRRGRRVGRIVGYGPHAQHAGQLRQARTAAGSPSYKVVGKGAQMSESLACEIASPAKRLPTAQQCTAFLTSVKRDGTPITTWCADHADYERRAAFFRPDLTGAKDRPATWAAARDALARDGITDRMLLERRADAAQHPVPKELPGPVPSEQQLLAACTDAALLWQVFLGGCSPDDVLHWKAHLDRLPPEPTPQPRPARAPLMSRRTLLLAGAVAVLGAGGVAYVLDDDDARTPGGQPGRGATGSAPPPFSLPAGGPAAAELDAIIAAAERSPDTTGGTAHVDLLLSTFKDQVTESTDELDWSPTAPGRRLVTGIGVPPTPEPLPAGPPTGAAGPPSADPAALQRTLEALRRPGGAAVLLLGVADLCHSYPLHRAERVAVLRMLRAATDLEFTGKAIVERLGLPGKAFSADTPGVRETLVFDPRDGRLLSHETLRRQPDMTYLPTQRVIYLRSTWDDLPD